MHEAKLAAVDPDELAARYRAGFTLKEIAAEHGVSYQTIRYHLKKHGVRIRKSHVSRRMLNDDERQKEK